MCSLFEVPFKRLFAPTSRSWMPKIFWDLESLWKSNGKKWSQISTFFLKICCGEKSFLNLITFEVPFKRLFVPTSQSRTSKLFRDLESCGESIEKKWSQIWNFVFKNGLKSPRWKSFLRILFPFFTHFKRLFAPTSWRPMPKLFQILGEN